jgi:NitT/TauT family transport system ATP-binding protein
MKNKILELKNISKFFLNENAVATSILDDINIDFNEGEIVGIIGRSGCGKSTLLRIIAGLIPESSGNILLKNEPINDENAKISMVFQTFGLFPWLTIFENIALGLKNKGIDEKQIKAKVETAVNLVGLSGFEEAYPREISGGMRQRIGFARAIVVDPEILILDEPFSALDYLTANILKADLLDLWHERSISSIKTIILVTHSLEEAITLCDRIIVLSSNPGKVIANISVDIDHPRDHEAQDFHNLLSKLYSVITKKNIELEKVDGQIELHMRYPQSASITEIIGFMELLKQEPYNGCAQIPVIAKKLQLIYKDMLPIIESLLQLKFVDINNNIISLSSAGNIILDADENAQKNILKEHMVSYVEFINNIFHTIKASSSKSLTKKQLLAMMKADFSKEDAENIFKYTIDWIRYTELLNYNAKNKTLNLAQLKNS